MRDIYIVSLPRSMRVQDGPLSPTPSRWRTITRREVRELVARQLNAAGSINGRAKVWIEPRRETARIARTYGFRPRTLARPNRR